MIERHANSGDRLGPDPLSPAGFRLDRHPFYYFSRILALRNRRLNADLRAFGLDTPRWRVLAVLNELPGCSMQQLAEATAVDRTTLTHTLRLMEGEGLVRREPRPTDRRSVSIRPTEAGTALLARILPTVLRHTDLALTGFTLEETDTLRALLARMAENLQDQPASGADRTDAGATPSGA